MNETQRIINQTTQFRSFLLLQKWQCDLDKRQPCLVFQWLEQWIQSWIWCDCQQGAVWNMGKLVSCHHRARSWRGRPPSSCFFELGQILLNRLPCQWKCWLRPKVLLWVEKRVSFRNISTNKLKGRSCLQHQGQWRNLSWNCKHNTTQVQRCQALFEWSLVWDTCTFWKAFKPQDHCWFDYAK